MTDPVCGREVKVSRAASSVEYMGRSYHFCSLDCGLHFCATLDGGRAS
ncbi:YHS domain-containing protein [Actinotalea subterranea]